MQKLSVSDLFSWSSAPIDLPAGLPVEDSIGLLEIALGAAPIPVVMTRTNLEPEGPSISFVNPAFCTSTGYRLHELVGKSVFLLRGPNSNSATQERLGRELAAGRSFEGEDINYRKDGSEYTARWSVAPIRDGAGRAVRYLSFQTHTDRVRGSTVAESGNLLELLFHSNGAGICLIDDGRRFVRVNPACAAIFGYPEAELLASSLLIVIRPEERERVARRFDEFIAGRGEAVGEYTILKKGGEPRRVLIHSERLNRRDSRRYQLCTVTDITERYRAEKQLQDRERLLRTLFDVAPVGILVTRTDDRIFDANAAMLKMLGGTREQLARLPFRSMTRADARESERGPVDELERGVADQVQIRKTIVRPDGSEFLADQHTKVVRDAKGRSEYYVHAVTDITAQESTTRQLEESESVLRRVTASIPGAVYRYTVRRDGTDYFQFLSDGAAKLFEMPLAEILADPGALFGRIHDDSLRVGSATRVSQTAHSPTRTTYRFLLPTGKAKWVYDQSVPEPRAEDGSVTWNGSFTDVTHLRHAKEQLRIRLEQLQAIGDNLPDGVVFRTQIDPDGSVRHLYFSKGVARVLGVSVHDVTADPDCLASLVLFSDREQSDRAFSRSVANGEPFAFEARMRHPNGEIRWTHWRGQPHRLADGRVLIDGIILDITEKKRSEEKLAAADRDQRLMQGRLQELAQFESVSLLAGGVAHDFNNLMTAVLGFANLANDEIPPGQPIGEYLSAVILAATRATELCRQLLGVAGKRQQPVQPLDLSEIVREMSSLLGTVVPKTIPIELDLCPVQTVIVAEPTQIRQIVMNLITNAAQAIGERAGTIRLRTAIVDLDGPLADAADNSEAAAAGRFVRLDVSDTGSGIPPELLNQIFDPYFTTKAAGHGLGLAAVRGILRTLRGAIRIETAPGRGTTFELFFPASIDDPKPASHAHRIAATLRRVGPVPVLVIRPEADRESVIEATLKSAGFQVTVVDDHLEASDALRRGRSFAAIVMDMDKPEWHGVAMLRTLHVNVTNVPTVVLAGHLPEAVHSLLGDDPRIALLAKPYLPVDLLASIEAVLKG